MTPTGEKPWLPPRRSRRSARATLSGDEVAVPAETGLWCPPLGRVVHVHKPEALPVPPAPLEVVHETPDEIALQRHSLPGRSSRGGNVGLQVLLAFGVEDAAFVVDHIGEGGTVLGDVNGLGA